MFSAAVSLLLWSMAPAHAACDSKALSTQLAGATPQQLPAIFTDLAACDPTTAKKEAATALPRLIPGEDANKAIIAALGVGASAETIAWMKSLQPDDKSQTVAALGDACAKNPPVQQFFVDSAASMGDAFWSERWYRALATCRTPQIQTLLTTEIGKEEKLDQSRFLGVLEVFSRNVGAAAIPKLGELATATQDAELQTDIVSAYSDAAGVGSSAGMDAKAAQAAVKALIALAPQLQPKAVEQARVTLQSLGDDQAADALAAVRYKAVKQSNGQFMWGAIVTENATCKNGKTSQAIHVGEVLDPGRTWPDELQPKVEAGAKSGWGLDLADKCKGTEKVDFLVAPEPFADANAFKAWADKQVQEVEKTPADKRTRVDNDALSI